MRLAANTAALVTAAVICLAGLGGTLPAAAGKQAPKAGKVWSWGYLANTIDANDYAAAPIPVPAAGKAIAVASGHTTAYALRADGTVVAWGGNEYGTFGNGTVTPSTVTGTPTPVKGLPRVTAIAAGGSNAFAIGPGGRVWGWGQNYSGELGNGTTKVTSTPTPVRGLTGITQVVATDDGQVWARRSDGTVWAIGQGYLGTGDFVKTMVPVRLTSLGHVTEIAGSSGNGYALLANGTVWAWGSNGNELGNGTTSFSATPVRVKGLTGIEAIAGGEYDGYALRGDGTVWAWGQNATDELGHGSAAESTVPVQVQGVAHAIAIVAGATSSFAILAGGTVKAWGFDNFGALGAGAGAAAAGQSAVPLTVKLSHVSTMTAGESGQLAIVG